MKWHFLIIVTAILLSCFHFAFAKGIRTLTLSENDVAQVRVSLGYSTLLQFDSRPNQVIVGDQDSFKVEYAGNSIAIKPVLSGVSTNLFIVTDYDKFNFRISSGQGFEPDYILRVKRKKELPQESSSGLITRMVNASTERSGVALKLISVASTKSNTAMIYSFEVAAKDQKFTFQPGDFEVTQAGRSLPIENIYLERLELSKGQKAYGMILIRKQDIRRKQLTTLRLNSDSIKGGVQVPAPLL